MAGQSLKALQLLLNTLTSSANGVTAQKLTQLNHAYKQFSIFEDRRIFLIFTRYKVWCSNEKEGDKMGQRFCKKGQKSEQGVDQK